MYAQSEKLETYFSRTVYRMIGAMREGHNASDVIMFYGGALAGFIECIYGTNKEAEKTQHYYWRKLRKEYNDYVNND